MYARETTFGNVKPQISGLPFSDIPQQSRLFLDYLKDPVSLHNYYPNAVVSPSQIDGYIPDVLKAYETDRSALTTALLDYNTLIGATDETRENISLLRDSNTVAIVTGQQAGLFTGPLYTIYKALSAIKLARTLRERSIKAVPVFWIASDDHDFDEVSHTTFLAGTGRLYEARYRPKDYVDRTPVGNVMLDDGIGAVIEELSTNLLVTEYSEKVISLLRETWADGERFGTAFGRTLASVLGKLGIIFIDPTDQRIRQLAAPLVTEAIDKAEIINERLIKRGKDLVARGYHAQVTVENDYFPLFWINDAGLRRTIRKASDGIYRVKEDQQRFPLAELKDLSEAEPVRFSPGVMLRPVVQDYLLPTACYFGGAAEVAYFAQNSEVYEVLGRPVTPIFHRQSFTVVEASQRRTMEKFHLDLPKLFEGKEKIGAEISENVTSPQTVSLFSLAEENINTELHKLDGALGNIDATLLENLAKRRRKILYHIAALRSKTLRAALKNDEIATRQLDSLFASILPGNALQERSVNLFSYINKFGFGFIDWIYNSIDLDDKDHRIVQL